MKKLHMIILLLLGTIISFAVNPEDIYDIKTKIRDLEVTVSKNPKDAAALYQLALSYEILSENGDAKYLENARINFQNYLKLDPYNSVARVKYGKSLVMSGQKNWFLPAKMWFIMSGTSEMTKAAEVDPENFNVRYIRGSTCFELTEYSFCIQTAITDFEYILSNKELFKPYFENETINELNYKLGYCYIYTKNYEKAFLYLDDVINNHPYSIYYAPSISLRKAYKK